MNKILFSLFLVVTSSVFYTSVAQPIPYGCQHWRNLGGKGLPHNTTSRDLNQSILRSDTFDILHYDISIDVSDYSGKTVKATTKIRFVPIMTGQTSIRFDLYQLQVDSVKDESGQLQFSNDSLYLLVNLPQAPALSDTLELEVFYQGLPHTDSIWGGFYFVSDYIYNLGIGISSIPPNFGKVWYPCFDSFYERATYTYHVKSTGIFRAHCQGRFTNETALGGDTVIRTYEFNKPIPTHLSAIAASNYEDLDYTHIGNYGPVPIRLTAKPADTASMRSKFQSLGLAIDACEHWYGPTGWDRVGYILTTKGALEIPENIAYPQSMMGQSGAVNRNLYAHELGHYWWGDWIAPYNHNDMWLKEGPAEYSSHLAVEWQDGKPAFINAVKENQYYVLQRAHLNDGGFFPLSPIPDSVIYGDHTYKKGAAVMHNLRAYLGDSLFRKGLSATQANHSFESFTPDQFRESLETETGADLQDFFNDQIYAPGFSTFVADSFHAVGSGNNWSVDVFILQRLRKAPFYYSNVPLDVTLVSENRERAEFQVVVDGQFSTVNLTAPFKPALVILNGNNRLNQCRMDFEYKINPGANISSVVPRCDFRIFIDNIPDTTFLRIEHVWAGPDTSSKGPGIYKISPDHYWTVDGIWPAGTAFHAQLNYAAGHPNDLDYSLYKTTEAKATLVYRASAAEPWTICRDFRLTAGDLTNGSGYVRIDKLRKGHYAFANGEIRLGMDDQISSDNYFSLFPNPANDRLKLEGSFSKNGNASIEIYSIEGKLQSSAAVQLSPAFERTFDCSRLNSGSYFLVIRNAENQVIQSKKFVIVR
jgi:hypothetical protein